MIFSSTLFIFIFLPVTLAAYFIVPKRCLSARNAVLLAASIIFYAWGEPKNIILMLASIIANYIFGRLIGAPGSGSRRRLWLVLSVVFNLGLLGYFKYFNLFTGGLLWKVTLPIGISFFTFQIMSYVIDVYRGNVAPQNDIFKLALYISFFPQLIAGPIVRYIDIEKQLTERETTFDGFAAGATRFVRGFAKKILISNTLAAFVDPVFNGEVTVTAAVAWAAAIGYAGQIFFDFSGYSDMAIGLGKMFGFDFLENFDYPYISGSVKEFWRRWHMSLSTWFRDYLYIPLGGSRKGFGADNKYVGLRTYLNLVIVFACTGFWHGASWTFLIWGLYHGFFLVLERAFLGRWLDKLPKAVGVIYTLLVVLFGWVLFRADTLADALAFAGIMFDFGNAGFDVLAALCDRLTVVTLIASVILSTPVFPRLRGRLERIKGKNGADIGLYITDTASLVQCGLLLCLSVMFLTGSDYNPFIYFRF